MPGISEFDSDQILAELLDFLRSERGFDFTDYKLSTVRRRVERRMAALGIESIRAYVDHLKNEPAEFPLLLDLLLINVTDFFRDQEAWDALSRELAEPVKQAARADRGFRVWCPGCATGEEAYTIAIVLAELMGEDVFRSLVRIFATDIDENALVRARSGTYAAREMESIRPNLRDKYFTPKGGSYVFRSDLRPSLTFGRHDVITDPPISRLDLLSFRNTLIYFNSDLQRRILGRFRSAITPDGLLFLGRSESLVLQQDYFKPVDVRNRIFTPVPQSSVATQSPRVSPTPVVVGAGPIGTIDVGAAQAGPFAQFILGLDGNLIGANSSARAQFSITERDLGRSVDALLTSQLPFSLTSIIEAVHATLTPQTYSAVERNLAGDQMQYLDVVVSPLINELGAPIGTSVVAIDKSEVVRLRLERDLALEEAQALSEELKSSIQDLQSTNEELETSNEELQSMNEELETTNEELSSALSDVKSLADARTRSVDRSAEDGAGEIDRIVGRLLAGVVLVVDGVVRYANNFANNLLASTDRGLNGLSWDEIAARMTSESDTHLATVAADGNEQSIPIFIVTGDDGVFRCRLARVEADGDPVRELILLLPEGRKE